ncbi:TetR family transcriptional regulator [Virgisporangium aliadipatigenens]|uniref:TetR family transcriptional regulator n=1 Tax=Virgisporangium aliadipatigenens TaxID=741659 RepID=A0A8J3YFC9_9ACTN|nr:TetR/AcrR family transcriptional regulator [Virgisporangium aliadipatigenens]GIJ44119.1 TetR family transcriptional regulator [Virgisporangium aliadipatigenens]
MSDPRAARSREAILGAARELLFRHGSGAVTHQRVAEHAGVGRATVYRHWPRADQLLLDAMTGSDMPFFKDPAPPVRDWLTRELRILADDLAQPPVVAVSLTLMHDAHWDEGVARQRDASLGTVAERLGAAFALAYETGEILSELAGYDAVALLTGPIFYRAALQGGGVPDGFIARLVDGLPWASRDAERR